jgi:hypothetical protein
MTTGKKNKGRGLFAHGRTPEMKFLSENEIEIRKAALMMMGGENIAILCESYVPVPDANKIFFSSCLTFALNYIPVYFLRYFVIPGEADQLF